MMQLPQVEIQQTHAKIGIDRKDAKLGISQPKADMSIEQPQADIQYHRRPPKLTIDQTEAWESMGIFSVFRSVEKFVQQAKRDWNEGIGKAAMEGDELMRIENGGAPLSRQSERNSRPKQHEFNVGFIPPPFSVKFNYDPGDLRIDVQQRKPIINAKANKPSFTYQPGDVSIYLKQKNTISFQVGDIIDKFL